MNKPLVFALVLSTAALVEARQLRPASGPDARSVVLGQGVGALRLDAVGERMFRARVAWTNVWTESPWNRYGVFDHGTFADEKFSLLPDGIATAAAELRGAADGAVTFRSKVSKAAPKLKLANAGKGFRLEATLDPGERLFGLGDCGRESVNRRGGRHRSTIEVYNQPAEKRHRYWCAAPVTMLWSSEGWGLVVNSSFLLEWDVGATVKDKLVVTAAEGDLDVYLFCGRGPREILDVYTRLTGRPALMPAYALGLTFICNDYGDMHEIMKDARLFRDRDIPCDTMSLEPDWMSKWYDLSTKKDWDRTKFQFVRYAPNHCAWIDALDRMGIKLGLWSCCNYDLTRYEEDLVAGRAAARAATAKKEGAQDEIDPGLFGGNNVKKAEAAKGADDGSEPWAEHWKKFYAQGVRVIKMDGCQQMDPKPPKIANGMSVDELKNCYNMMLQKQMVEGFVSQTKKRPFMITACASLGTQQYCSPWAGDTGGGEFPVVSILNMGLSGQPNMSMDMNVYWTKQGYHAAFLATWPMHCNFAKCDQPWQLGGDYEAAYRHYAKLRYRLIPYIYSFAAEARRTGYPYVRPMSLAYPDDPKWDGARRQWMLGDSLLVSAYADEVELPPGVWYDARDDRRVAGNTKEKVVSEGVWNGSLHVKAGAIIPTWENVSHIEKGWNEKVVFHVWPEADGDFLLYEDDGESMAYRKGSFATTPVSVRTGTNAVTRFTVGARKGRYDRMPGARQMSVVFHLGGGKTRTVDLGLVGGDGREISVAKPTFDSATVAPRYLRPSRSLSWTGRRIAVFGDSISDSRLKGWKHWWEFVGEELNAEMRVYAQNGTQWSAVPGQMQKMIDRAEDDVDAVLVFMGTNDYNSNIPLGVWWKESETEVNHNGRMVKVKRRLPDFDPKTVRGRINIALDKLKGKFPDRQIVLMTPIRRGYFKCAENNVQPEDSYSNEIGLYIGDYAHAVREAGEIWSVPVIDTYSESGLLLSMPSFSDCCNRATTDRLHPSSEGCRRLALTVAARLKALPPTFRKN